MKAPPTQRATTRQMDISPASSSRPRPALPQLSNHAQVAPLRRSLLLSEPTDSGERVAEHIARTVTYAPVPSLKSVAPPRNDSSTRCGGEVAPAVVHEVLGEPGVPLPRTTQQEMRYRLGHDFSHVRLHTGPGAAAAAHAVQARAFTQGQHVVFARGEYAPETTKGRSLLAHELVHVLQQNNGTSAHSAPIQRATIDPEIARRNSRRRIPVLQAAVDRVPAIVQLALSALNAFLGHSETAEQRNAIASAFGVTHEQPDWQAQTRAIIATYTRIRDIIASPQCMITFDATATGYAMFIPAITWEIQVQRDFFYRRPPGWWPRNHPFDLRLHQALTLLHEAVHYIHGLGHLQSPMINPFNYQQFILELTHGAAGTGARFQGWHREFSRREQAIADLFRRYDLQQD